MKGNLQQCIAYIKSARNTSILLRAGDQFIATQLHSAAGRKSNEQNIIGVFRRTTPVDVIIYEAS